jgi:hypothetical protein
MATVPWWLVPAGVLMLVAVSWTWASSLRQRAGRGERAVVAGPWIGHGELARGQGLPDGRAFFVRDRHRFPPGMP